MAEAVGLAASIIGIAGAGFAVAKCLYSIGDGLGSAGVEVRAYADEICAFSRLLGRVRDEILRPGGIQKETQSLLEDILEACERVVGALDQLRLTVEPLLEQFAQSTKKYAQLRLRLLWLFKTKDQLLFYRSVLRGQHRILDTMLDVMILQAVRSNSPQSTFVRISLKQSVTSVQQSLAGSTDVQMEPWVTGLLALGGTVAAPGGTTQPALLAGPPSSETKKISPGGVSEEVKPSAADGSAPDQTIMEISEITDTSSTVHGILPASVTEPEEDSAQLVEAHIDTKLFPDPDYSALEIWEDLRVVSRKVVRLAKKTLSSNDNENSSRTTLAHSSEEVLGSLANTFELADSFGNKYYIDLDHCATWELLHEIITQLPIPEDIPSYAIDHYRQAANGGRFVLITPDRLVLVDSMWKEVAKPGLRAKIQFNDPQFNRPVPPIT